MAIVAVTIVLLGLLVWFLNPRQPDLKPAPLKPPSSECLKPGREFVPTNLTSIADPALDALPAAKKMAALVRLNTTACTCGCQLSLAYCHQTNAECEVSGPALKHVADAASQDTGRAVEKK